MCSWFYTTLHLSLFCIIRYFIQLFYKIYLFCRGTWATAQPHNIFFKSHQSIMEKSRNESKVLRLGQYSLDIQKKTCSAIFFLSTIIYLFIYLTDSVFSFWSKPFQLYDMIFIFLVLAVWNVAAVKGIYIYIYTYWFCIGSFCWAEGGIGP